MGLIPCSLRVLLCLSFFCCFGSGFPFSASAAPRSPRAGPDVDPRTGMAALVRRILEEACGFAPGRAAATAARVVQGLAPSTVASYLAMVWGFERHSGRPLLAKSPIPEAAL